MLGLVRRAHPRTCEPLRPCQQSPDECIEPIDDDQMNSPRTALIVTYAEGGPEGSFLASSK